VKRPFLACAALILGLVALTSQAKEQDGIVSLGDDTYAATRTASTGWVRNTDKLKALALGDAAAYCAKLQKELKVLNTTTDRPGAPLMGIAYAKVVFKALDANDPELRTPVLGTSPEGVTHAAAVAPPAKSKTAIFYDDLMLLDDLRKRGLLTDEQFEARKQKLLDESK